MAFAFEALEEGGDEDVGVVWVGELLEEIAATLEDAKAAPYTGLGPQGIIESWAVTAVFCGVENSKRGFKNSVRVTDLE